MAQPARWNEVNVEVDGRTYRGQYSLVSKVITVNADMGSKKTQLGGHKPEVLAQMLLRELVREGKD